MEKWEEAYQDYKEGTKYREIAQKYGVSVSAVKSWANRKWKGNEPKKVAEDTKKIATKKTKKLQTQKEKLQYNKVPLQPKKRGAPKGNQNAVGNNGGTPEGSKNNYKLGIYEKINPSLFSEEEKKLFYNADSMDALTNLKRDIEFKGITIMRLYERMLEVQGKGTGLMVSDVTSTKINMVSENKGTVMPVKQLSPYKEVVQTNAVSTDETTLKFMEVINRLGNQRMKGLVTLLKYELELEQVKNNENEAERLNGNNIITIKIENEEF